MAFRGADNLRCYLREAVLPVMVCDAKAPSIPPEGHKSHLNHLKVKPERWRRLENIQPLECTIMDKWVTDCWFYNFGLTENTFNDAFRHNRGR
jgi:hypothetical protein